MSREREEEEEDECFQDSLDRLLSSTASSCSPSSDDEDEGKDPNSISDWPNCAHQDRPFPVPKFRMGVSNNYDVWISEPSSVEERRIRLLLQMGLSRDSFLSSQNPSISALSYAHGGSVGSGVFGRSVSSYHLNRNQQHGETTRASDSCIIGNSDPGIVRSRSDGSKDRNCPHQRHKKNASVSSSLFNYNSSSVYPSEILLINSPSVVNETFDGGVLVNNNHAFSRFDLRNGNGSPTTSAISLNKPPSGKGIRRGEQVITDSLCSIPVGNCNSSPVSGGGTEMEDSDSNGVGGMCHQVCTIKNLDDGKQFVVNEVREDGMWNKLKEVSTGRQLTMDEFEMCVGHSPIVQELMRRQNAEDVNTDGLDTIVDGSGGDGSQLKKRGSWLKSIRSVASSVTGHKERRGSDEKDTSSEKGGRRSSSATDDSQDVSYHGRERIRVRQYGKSSKNLTSVYKIQDIQAHNGSIWTIKFSLDGKYLASAGEDCDIHVWKVLELEKRTELLMDKQEDGNFNFSFFSGGSPEPTSLSPGFDNHPEKRRRGRSAINRKLVAMEHIMLPDTVFALSEKPTCSLQGHVDDVLDLSWSKSQQLLSSSMDKTVRLWNIPSKTCLKIFSHSDYVTCIQFNPVDDRYFISGSLDAKVRIWSISACQVVDWNDVHEMVTAACYTPDGQGALVGSYKGSCHLYNISDNKLQQKSQINLQNKKKKGHHKKITGFQFAPGSTSEVLITSADSRIRVVDGLDLVHKFKGFRNTNSQISASFAANGKYVVSASEDSHVYVWKHEGNSRPSRSKGATVTQYYEHFHCQEVSVAITWPGVCDSWESEDLCYEDLSGLADHLDEVCTENHPPTPVEEDTGNMSSSFTSGCSSTPLHGSISSATNSYFYDRISATWPEEKLLVAAKNHSPHPRADFLGCVNQSGSAWGLVIVTASLRGEIRTFQNFGFPVRL